MSSISIAINSETTPALISTPITRKSGVCPKQSATTPSGIKVARVRRTLAHRWDMYAVLTLMASAVAYGVWTLSHLAG